MALPLPPLQILTFYVYFMEKRMKGDWTKSSRQASTQNPEP